MVCLSILKDNNFRLVSAYGVIFGWVSAGVLKSIADLEFKPDQFMYLLLPPIVLYSGLKFNSSRLERTFGTSMAFAWLGTIGTALWVSLGLWGVSSVQPWIVAFWIGSILSPTDPVGTLDMMRHQKRMGDVRTVLEHESLLNDAVAVLLVHMARHAWLLEREMTKTEAFEIITMALLLTVAASALGAAVAYIVSFIQTPNTVAILGMLIFSFSESFGASGIITLFVYGATLSRMGVDEATFKTIRNVSEMSELYVYVAMGFVFVLADVEYIKLGLHAIAACVTGRIINVMLFGLMARTCGVRWSLKELLLMSTCGMRGAVSLALAVYAPEPLQAMFVTITVMEVIASMFYTILMTNFITRAL